jgi:predicted membrane protein
LRKNNAIVGFLISVLICGILIFSIEKNYSFLQIIIGFIVYILPSIFITSLQSKLTVFLISSSTIMLGFLSYKYQFYEVWVGVLEAIIIGRAINFYKIRNKQTNKIK